MIAISIIFAFVTAIVIMAAFAYRDELENPVEEKEEITW